MGNILQAVSFKLRLSFSFNNIEKLMYIRGKELHLKILCIQTNLTFGYT